MDGGQENFVRLDKMIPVSQYRRELGAVAEVIRDDKVQLRGKVGVKNTSVERREMSTRWYPLYQRGNPQQRIFLPNFWLKLVRPQQKQPPNIVQFIVSMQMTKYDIRNYLEKIYKIPVVDVRTVIAMGKTKQDELKGYVTKEDDYKVAFVTLPRGQEFEFPDLFPKDEKKLESDAKTLDETKKNYRQFLEKSNQRPGMPGWYSF